MKKLLLFVLAFGIGFSSFAQVNRLVKKDTKAPRTELKMEAAPKISSDITNNDQPTKKTEMLNGRAVSFIPMGQSGNAYGLYGNSRTYLWADPNVNSVVFTHRMTGEAELEGNSRLAYDVSTDGGATFTNNVQVYTPLGAGTPYPIAAARYPQGAIINPEGNTDPANAYYTYFACTLDQSNGGSWGGYGYGSNVLNETDPPAPSQVNLTTGGGYYRLIPDALTVTTKGVSWYVEPSTDYSTGSSEYSGELIVGKGEIVDGAIEYEESLIEFMAPLEGINDCKIAFGPDGMTGYILIMTDGASDPLPFTSYHPALLKTTDGGATWSNPIQVQFGGVDGIEAIKYYWTDELIESLDAYEPGFNRDEVWYNMGFHSDIVVDEYGNPHITGLLTVASADGWYPSAGAMATWHIYSDNGGTSWNAQALYDNLFFDGAIGDIFQYNRPYASSTLDGHYLFFSWIDTDFDGAEENINPNIFVVGYDVEDHFYTDVYNVTRLTSFWYSAFYGSMAQYVFADLNETEQIWNCEIPFMLTEFTVPGDDTKEMNFWYINGFTMSMPVGIEENINTTANFSVAQNTPNPAVNNTSILVTTETGGDLNLKVSNVLGQVVYQETTSNSALGHTFNVNVSDLESGIYFYTVKLGKKSITKKMLVK
ncbi:MAG: T9SS type A sorting domain-containing protein [Bacteroidales bacterium]|nr:T9SS type A sorting domain-containing protein [Bacteroidales bacterium]